MCAGGTNQTTYCADALLETIRRHKMHSSLLDVTVLGDTVCHLLFFVGAGSILKAPNRFFKKGDCDA